MIDWIAWYITTTLLGLLACPIAFRLLGGLKDRGYLVSRTLGLLIWGFCFWLPASLGALPNNTGGLLFAAGILLAISVWSLSGNRWREIQIWLSTQKKVVITGEALFLVAFAGWAIVRAANPEAVGTEKPMELAFINAILRSPTFPPHDPWLSGFAISYYYFGYVLTAMLAMISGTPGGVAFNLGVALVFALSACGAYGLVYNLLNARKTSRASGSTGNQTGEAGVPGTIVENQPRHTFSALLGPLFVLLVSNLEGFLDMLHSAGLFWQRNADGTLSSVFWKWLDIQDLSAAPAEPFSFIPSRFWWWWRASRVLQDFDVKGAPREIIDEFPFFSYLLADLHPHVLAMPFAFLAMTLALNIFLGTTGMAEPGFQIRIPQRTIGWAALLAAPLGLAAVIAGAFVRRISLVGIGFVILVACIFYLWHIFGINEKRVLIATFSSDRELTLTLDISPGNLLLAAVSLGALAFLNTWDFPVYVFVFAGAYALRQIIRRGKSWAQAIVDLIWVGGVLGVGGVLLYLPFYLGFSSQAGGILPNLVFPTRGAHFWVMFAPLLIPIIGFLIFQQEGKSDRRVLWKSFIASALILLGLWLIFLLMGWGITFIPERGQQFLGTLAADSARELIRVAVIRRLTMPGTWLTLLFLQGLSLNLFWRIGKRAINGQKPACVDQEQIKTPVHRALELPDVFVLLIIFTGLMLVLVPEFFFLLDMFGWRMNTIFKFYFSAWMVWGIAAACSVITLSQQLKGLWNSLFRVTISLVLLASLTYPVLSLLEKTNNFQPSRWTLDSTAYFALENPDEKTAIDWLKTAPFGVIAEAVPATGGSYTGSARMSTQSGMPSVLGWVGHENQWRGGNEALGSRQSDLERLYCTRDWDEAQMILDQYQIRYLIVGNLERSVYQPNNGLCPAGLVEGKFSLHLNPVFSQNGVSIYEYAGAR